jgi:hypothetical protein
MSPSDHIQSMNARFQSLESDLTDLRNDHVKTKTRSKYLERRLAEARHDIVDLKVIVRYVDCLLSAPHYHFYQVNIATYAANA